MVERGINVNEVNDDYLTPFVLSAKAQDARLDPLEDFLTDELGAHLTYSGLSAEIRALKRIAWDIVTCNWCKQKNS